MPFLKVAASRLIVFVRSRGRVADCKNSGNDQQYGQHVAGESFTEHWFFRNRLLDSLFGY
jgi:hypothetical protein